MNEPRKQIDGTVFDEPFEQFLQSVGLQLQVRRGPEGEPFGNWIIQYENAELGVSLIHDRAYANVGIIDKATMRPARGLMPAYPASWGVSFISKLLTGSIAESFVDQKEFLRNNWKAIVELFAPSRREATHQQLASFARENFKKRMGDWPPAILKFEQFFRDAGLICETKEAPDGVLGNRLMLYSSPSLNVKISSSDGWRLRFSSQIRFHDQWYDIRTLRRVLHPYKTGKMSFQQWFEFAQSNWDRIVTLFQDEQDAATYERLRVIEADTRQAIQFAKEQRDALTKSVAKSAKQPKENRISNE